MHPYIIILLLPLIGVVVFFVLPLPQATASYVVILLISGVRYWVIVRAMRRRPKYGVERMIGTAAMVVSKLRPQDEAEYIVRVRGELWSADSSDDLKPGETVTILAVQGIKLVVGKSPAEQSQPKGP
jgi:membrane protein implicated in regulation of membrane protease activity